MNFKKHPSTAGSYPHFICTSLELSHCSIQCLYWLLSPVCSSVVFFSPKISLRIMKKRSMLLRTIVCCSYIEQLACEDNALIVILSCFYFTSLRPPLSLFYYHHFPSFHVHMQTMPTTETIVQRQYELITHVAKRTSNHIDRSYSHILCHSTSRCESFFVRHCCCCW